MTVVVPFTAGSATDIMARTVAERLSAQLGQPFVIENRPGAGGTIGMAAVARAEPDGYTILVHSSSYTVTPTTYPNTPYDTLRDLSGITPLGTPAQRAGDRAATRASRLGEGSGRGGEGQARRDELRVGRASGRATQLNAERFRLGAGIRGRPRAVQGHARGADRSDRRARRLSISARSIAVLPLIAGKKLAGAGHGQHKALGGAARPADDARSGHPELGLQFLGRHGRCPRRPRATS